ncbi:MAG: hypothetical protein KAQ64_05205 [Candidatus Pacebacteria bacterium]|nr:hypothetical protein [Candidatus Paceibacterota bacterium]
MKINFGKKILKEIKDKKEYFAMFFSVIIFLFFAVSVFWGVNPEQDDIPDYESLVENNFNEYNKNINRVNNSSQKILENGQLNEITKYNNLIEDSFHIQRNKNPFIKSF